MNTRSGSRNLFLTSLIAALSGTILLSASQNAQASPEHRGGFRSFREQNPDIDRYTARQMFLADRKNQTADNAAQNAAQNAGRISRMAGPTFTMTMGPDGIIRCGTPDPGMLRDDKKNERIRNQSFQFDSKNSLRVNNGVNLDLTSNQRNIVLGRSLFAGENASVSINVGGESKTVSAGSQVTAAEYVAVKQVLAGEQKVSVDRAGRAIGGEVDLGSLTNDNDVMRASNLVIAENVTTYGDFGKRSDFRLLGNLSNYGSVQALSTDADVKSGALRARDISNYAGALINSTVDLTLDASGKFLNEGSISSTGNLTINASNVRNSGSITSTNGNVNLDTAPDTALLVNNSKGVIRAENGAINIRSAEYTGSANSTVNGGDLLSQELNIHSGTGLSEVAVNELTGTVNQTGTAAHLLASTENLNLGSICLTGDPTYYNTAGSITISGDVIVGQHLVIAASGDILSSATATVAARDATQGYDITLIAGAAITADAANNSSTLPSALTGAITLSGKSSKTGGGILITNDVTFDTTPNNVAGNLNAGKVNMFAFPGKQIGAGTIDIEDATIRTGGLNLGANGDVLIYAGAKSGTTIRTGIIDALGSTAPTISTGAVYLFAGALTTFPKGPVSYDANGNLTSTSIITTLKKTSGDILIARRDISELNRDIETLGLVVSTGGNVQIDGDVTSLGVLSFNVSGNIDASSQANAMIGDFLFAVSNKGNIGTTSNPLQVEVDSLLMQTKGSMAAVEVGGTGTLDILTTFAADEVLIDAENKIAVTDAADPITSDTVRLDFFNYAGAFPTVSANLVELRTNDAAFNVTGVLNGKKTIYSLEIAGGIGTSVNRLEVLQASIVAAGAVGDIFINQTSTKEVEYGVAGANVDMISSGSVLFSNLSSAGTGDFLVNVTGKGTLTVDTFIDAFDQLTIQNSNAAGKIALATGAKLQTHANTVGMGNISVNLGTTLGPVFADPIANVEVDPSSTGTVTFTGVGLKAKSPVNIIFADGPNVSINNTVKNGNMTFGGDVRINAD